MVLKRIQAWAVLHTTAVVQYRGHLDKDKRCCCDLTINGKLEVKRKEWEAIPAPLPFFQDRSAVPWSRATAAHRVAGMYDWTGCATFREGLLREGAVWNQTWEKNVTGTFSKHCRFPARNGLSFRFLFSSVRTNYKEDSPTPPQTRNQKPAFWDPTLHSEIFWRFP